MHMTILKRRVIYELQVMWVWLPTTGSRLSIKAAKCEKNYFCTLDRVENSVPVVTLAERKGTWLCL